MKKFFRWLPALLICSAMSVACSDDPDTPKVDTPVDNPTEVRAKTSEGADITLIATDTRRFEWQITPRSECFSYRVDVKMRARMNEDYRMAAMEDSELTYEQYVQNRMFASDGTGAGAWVGTTEDGVSEPRDFSTDMTIFQSVMLPDTEYIIMVWGCRNNEGGNPAEYTEMRVRTDSAGDLIGNPEVSLDIITNTRYSQVKYTPNEDCAAYFRWELPEADVQEFLETVGDEAALSDIVCSYVISYATEASTSTRDLLAWQAQGCDTKTSVIAVAMDGNLTRNPTLFYGRYELKPSDPTIPAPDYKFTFIKNSALVVRFDLELVGEHTMNAYYCLNPSLVGQLPNNALELVLLGGWIVPREDPYQWQYVTPDTDYKLRITARNDQSVLKDMEEVKLCHTYPLGNFDVSKDEMKYEQSGDSDKTKFKMEFYPSENISCFMYCTLEKPSFYYDPIKEQVTDIDLTDPKNVEYMRTYMINYANIASPLQGDREHWGDFTYTGLEPGTTYTTFVLAETWDGNFVDVQYHDVTTVDNPGGPDPEVTFGEISVDKDKMEWSVEIIPNGDVFSMRYCCSTEIEASARIDDYDFETTPDEEKLAAWTEYILGDVALTNHGSKATSGGPIKNDELVLAIGQGMKDGDVVNSALAVARLDYNTMEAKVLNLSPKAQETIAKVVAKHLKAEKAVRTAAKPLPGLQESNAYRIIRCK